MKKIYFLLLIIILIFSNLGVGYLYYEKKQESHSNWKLWKENQRIKENYISKHDEALSTIKEKNRLISSLENEVSRKENRIYDLEDFNDRVVSQLENERDMRINYENKIREEEIKEKNEETRLKNTYEYKQLTQDISVQIDKWSYTQFRNKKRMSDVNDWKYMIYETTNEEYFEDFFSKLEQTLPKDNNNKIRTDSLIDFVQEFSYYNDVKTGRNEYPKYPVETIWDNGGDCEDTSILLASLIQKNGYGVALIEFEDHMGVGVLCNLETMSGDVSYFRDGDDTYCYIETTAKGWEIGDVPDGYDSGILHII